MVAEIWQSVWNYWWFEENTGHFRFGNGSWSACNEVWHLRGSKGININQWDCAYLFNGFAFEIYFVAKFYCRWKFGFQCQLDFTCDVIPMEAYKKCFVDVFQLYKFEKGLFHSFFVFPNIDATRFIISRRSQRSKPVRQNLPIQLMKCSLISTQKLCHQSTFTGSLEIDDCFLF